MKIAYIINDNGIPVFGKKGASIHIRELVSALHLLGHQITIFTAKRGTFTCPLEAKIVEVMDETVPLQDNHLFKNAYEKRLASEQRSCRLSDAIAKRVMTFHSQEAFELIYERYSLWSTAGIKAAKRLAIPFFVEVNAPLIEEQRKYRTLVLGSEAEAIEAKIFCGANAILAVSKQVKAYAISKGASQKRTLVIQNGVDIKRFQPVVQPARHQQVNGKFTLGFVGSLKVWHGTDILLKAFQLLIKRCPAYHLLIVGDGPQRSWIEDYVRDAHIGEKVTITGWVAYDKLPSLIQKMDITVAPYPSLDKFYFSPLKLFEYMAAGKPVVASRIGSIQEAIQDKVTGLLVRPGDSEDLVEKIEQLRSDVDLRKAMGRAASQEAEHHTWEQNARSVVDLVNLFRKKK